jgi:hypothetical protein
MRKAWVVALALTIGCGPPAAEQRGDDDPDDGGTDDGVASDGRTDCPPPPNAAGSDVELAAPFDTLYTAYDLGTVPGVPNPLGGTVILSSDPNTLLIAGGSENASGAIYSIGVTRDECGHIIGFAGSASLVASTPHVDANLVYTSADLLLYTEWPQFHLSQLAGSTTTPSRRTDLRTLGMPGTGDSGAGGLGIVPSGLPTAGEIRLVTWPGGRWYHAATAPDGSLLSVTGLTETVTVPNEPGGFAYVPAGSPGFTSQSVIVAEWRGSDATLDRVAVYDIDQSGDPIIATRREFFSKFPRPWGAYFEPVTGDYLFLSWGTGSDHVYIVQGFVPPPPIL